MRKRNIAAAILLASMMAVSAGFATMPTYASYTVGMGNTEDHTYEAYQIFKGSLFTDDKGTPDDTSDDVVSLSNITWGDNVDDDALLTALKADEAFGTGTNNAFKDCDTAAKVANVLKGFNDDSAQAKAFAKIAGRYLTGDAVTSGSGNLTIDDAGYYLFKDVTAATDLPITGDNVDARSEFLLRVVSDTALEKKYDTVTSEKTVTDANDTDGTTEAGKSTADYDIGDDVPYELTFTLPANYAEFSKYPVTFYDDMCAGLTFDKSATIIYGAGTGTSITFEEATGTAYAGGQKYEYTIADLKETAPSLGAGDQITIRYTAKLNANAEVGNTGNPNTYNVKFASDPSWTPNPSTPNEEPPSGETPKSTSVVFTYQVVLNKVNEAGQALTGADFRIDKLMEDGSWVDITELNGDGDTDVNPTKAVSANVFTFKGLDDGTYRLTETDTPRGYNTIAPIEFTIAPTSDGDLEDVEIDGVTFLAVDDENDCILEGNVINKSGATLPSTGGIGTTIFYVVGGTLVAGALVLLISKKRVENKEK